MSDRQNREKLQMHIEHLHELVAALDRRVPKIERVGEAEIAADAAALREKALTRLAELERERSE